MSRRLPPNANRRAAWVALLAALLLIPRPGLGDDPSSLNAEVLAFARERLGEKVGDGQCSSLVVEALESAGARFGPSEEPGGDPDWGRRLEQVEDARPGDVLLFRDAVFKGRRTYPNGVTRSWEIRFPEHLAIVARVRKSRRGLYLGVLHQNVGGVGRDDEDRERVQEGTLFLPELQPGGRLVAYRPVAD